MSTTFLKQILSGMLLLAVTGGQKSNLSREFKLSPMISHENFADISLFFFFFRESTYDFCL